jgi:hypothetical protein
MWHPKIKRMRYHSGVGWMDGLLYDTTSVVCTKCNTDTKLSPIAVLYDGNYDYAKTDRSPHAATFGHKGRFALIHFPIYCVLFYSVKMP